MNRSQTSLLHSKIRIFTIEEYIICQYLTRYFFISKWTNGIIHYAHSSMKYPEIGMGLTARIFVSYSLQFLAFTILKMNEFMLILE